MGAGGRSAEVFLNVHSDGRRYTLRSNRLRAVADSLLLTELRNIVGVNHVRVISGGAPRTMGNGNGAKKWQRSPAPELVEA